MDNQRQSSNASFSEDDHQKVAVPYIPPPPPDESSQKRFRSPAMNGIFIALVILVGGFMAYNAVGHQLTQLSAESTVRAISPTPTVTPTRAPSYP